MLSPEVLRTRVASTWVDDLPPDIRQRVVSRRRGNAASAMRPKYGEEIFTGNGYPRSWAEYIGQDKAKLQLQIALTSARRRQAKLGHTLIASGTPGIGKTALALLVAHESDVGIVEVSGTMDLADAQRVLLSMQDGDILFIDEIHRMVSSGKKNAEWLLHLMQDGVLMTSTGAIVVPDITVIGATTDAQRLPRTILDRFLIKPQLVEYTEGEAVQIAAGHARKLGLGEGDLPWPASTEWLAKVSRAGNRNPRCMQAILSTIRDIAIATGATNFDGTYDVETPLNWLGLTHDGLDAVAQQYLIVLASIFNGQAGEKTLASTLNEPGGLHQTEQVLMGKAFITIGAKGRELTEIGFDRAHELMREL